MRFTEHAEQLVSLNTAAAREEAAKVMEDLDKSVGFDDQAQALYKDLTSGRAAPEVGRA